MAYDALILDADTKETDTLGREGYVEHHIADHLVSRLSELDPATDEWLAHAKVLHEMLGHHIEEEETDIFAKLGDQFSREQLDAMGVRSQREKAAFVPTTSPKRAPAPQKTSTHKAGTKRPTSSPKRAPRQATKKTAKKRQ